MATENAKLIPIMIESNFAGLDQAVDIHLRMLFDWYTEVCEASLSSLQDILPKLMEINHPRVETIIGLAKKFLRDSNDYMQGYACQLLGEAAISFYEKSPAQFTEIVDLIINRAHKNRTASRRAAALNTLNNIFVFLKEKNARQGVQLRIVDVFRKNCKKLDRSERRNTLCQLDDEVFAFILVLHKEGEKEAALELSQKILSVKKNHNLKESYTKNVLALLEQLVKSKDRDNCLIDLWLTEFDAAEHDFRTLQPC